MTVCVSRFSLLLVAVLATAQAAEDGTRTTREAGATAVVFNTRDPESRALAEYYAERRAIPSENIIGLDCTLEEEISREEYVETIEQPLRSAFERNGWWEMRTVSGDTKEISGSSIRFMAVMRGVPLKIKTTIQPPAPDKPAPPRPNGGDPIRGHDEAAVDSELAALGAFGSDTFGIVDNPYYRRFSPILDSSVTAGLILVSRLDAPTAGSGRQ